MSNYLFRLGIVALITSVAIWIVAWITKATTPLASSVIETPTPAQTSRGIDLNISSITGQNVQVAAKASVLINLQAVTFPPTGQPSRQPSRQPSSQPTRRPTSQPSRQPSRQPSSQPTRRPTNQPTRQPTRVPSSQPTKQPINHPTAQPTRDPSSQPTKQPFARPSSQPTRQVRIFWTLSLSHVTDMNSVLQLP
jgi:hypothetical protein